MHAHQIDINADLGEIDGENGQTLDTALLRWITSANVACGAHAGSTDRMRYLASECATRDVAFGAHPGYQDRAGFGRKLIQLSAGQVRELVGEQVELALSVCKSAGIPLAHVKPHGALYNLAAADEKVAAAVADAVYNVSPQLRLFGLSGSLLIQAGISMGLETVSEAFADRNYQPDGTLVPRCEMQAVLHDPALIAQRALAMVKSQTVQSNDGQEIPINVQTLCIHSDTNNAPKIAMEIRTLLEKNGIVVSSRV